MKKQHIGDLDFHISCCVDLLRNSRLSSLGGKQVSDTNREIISRCVSDWLFLIEDLMKRFDIGEVGRKEKRENFLTSLLLTDFSHVISFFDRVYALLISGDRLQPQAFKAWAEEYAGHLFWWEGLLSPLIKQLYQALDESDPERRAFLLGSLAHFLRFPRKLELQDIGLEAIATESYLQTERELSAVNLDDCHDITSGIAHIIQGWFEGFRIETLLPSNGPGSVCEGSLTPAEKYSAMRLDDKLSLVLRNANGPLCAEEYFPLPPGKELERVSRTIFVPKTASKLRTISMEPATLQYVQQGVMKALYDYIELHSYLGVHVRLDDQRQNQVWALIGSLYGNYGTIDLSHASDSVSWRLVRSVFKSSPRLYRWLIATRSSQTVLPTGDTIPLEKYAPMGSALCFPIQCIIFSAIVEYASRRRSRRTEVFDDFWCVYGDDIIVSSHIYQDVIDILEALGFSVNKTKSYNTGYYRESCGKEYYYGVDITPLYYRTPFYKKRVTPSVLSSWCSSANNAYVHRLPLYRKHLIRKCLRSFPGRGPYFTDTPFSSPYLYSSSPTNFHVKRRWSKNYQREEGRFISVISKPRSGTVDQDNLRYFETLVMLARRPSGSKGACDEVSTGNTLNGCVDHFRSATLPLRPFTTSSSDGSLRQGT